MSNSTATGGGELVARFRKYGPALSGLYNCVARVMTYSAQGHDGSKAPMVPRELRQVCDGMSRMRSVLVSQGCIGASTWLPSFTHSQTNWVQSIWELLASDTIPEYVLVDSHLLFWVLYSRIEPGSRPDPSMMETELLQWTRYAERWNHQTVLAVLARLWPESAVVTSSPGPGHVGREGLQRGLFLDLFSMFLRRNQSFLEACAIPGVGRLSNFQAISRPTTSAGLEAQMWSSPGLSMNPSEFATYDTSVLTSEMDRLMAPQYGQPSSSVGWTVSPPPQDSYFSEGYFSEGVHGVRNTLSVSPPLYGQLPSGAFESPTGVYDDLYAPSSSAHLSPIAGDERPHRSDEEEGHVHGWDPEAKTCMLELPDGGICNTRVQTYNNFLRHCRFQHQGKEPREECTLCGQSFGRPDALRNHKEKSKKHKKLERLHGTR
ncbi:hypothetical protein DRE_04039 [Drechslerella stenobrocha 248]|uniref:C2H2-type domain-containing protein n=1 Tax=Drechslerella stenobrocha 248 TaxID=1043628 RepID=W7HTN5_9PEZI|nr:hypothetical protein DRE_04039 [Drechslerella stenobrocha 248]